MGHAAKGKRRILITGFGLFMLFLLAFVLFFWANFKTVEVKGESMMPTFKSGTRLLVSKAYWLVGRIKKNDVIVLNGKENGDVIIKRVYGLSGDKINAYNAPRDWKLANGDYTVPDGCVYVLGDNLPVSQDSRYYGPFKLSDVIGKVVIARLGTGRSGAAKANTGN